MPSPPIVHVLIFPCPNPPKPMNMLPYMAKSGLNVIQKSCRGRQEGQNYRKTMCRWKQRLERREEAMMLLSRWRNRAMSQGSWEASRSW